MAVLPSSSPGVQVVACDVCLREVPRSEAIVPEAEDYVAYFCGLECFQKWRAQVQGDAVRPESEPAAP